MPGERRTLGRWGKTGRRRRVGLIRIGQNPVGGACLAWRYLTQLRRAIRPARRLIVVIVVVPEGRRRQPVVVISARRRSAPNVARRRRRIILRYGGRGRKDRPDRQRQQEKPVASDHHPPLDRSADAPAIPRPGLPRDEGTFKTRIRLSQ